MQFELFELHHGQAALVPSIHVAFPDEPPHASGEFLRGPGPERDVPFPGTRLDPGGERALAGCLEPADWAARGADGIGEGLGRGFLLPGVGLLGDHEPVAVGDEGDRSEQGRPVRALADELPGVGQDREGTGAEHRPGRQPRSHLSQRPPGIPDLSPDAPALRCTGGEALRIVTEGLHGRVERVAVVAPEVGERGPAHRAASAAAHAGSAGASTPNQVSARRERFVHAGRQGRGPRI